MLSAEHVAFLESCRTAHLATVDSAGRPRALPICFAVVDGVIYTPIDAKPKRTSDPRSLARVRHILANPHVCVVADHYGEDWSQLAWLQVHGPAELLEGGPAHARAVEALRARYPQYRDMDLASRPMIAIRPERTVSWQAS